MGQERDRDLKAAAVSAYRASQASEGPKSLRMVAAEFGLGEATLKRANWRAPTDGTLPPTLSVGGRPSKLTDAEVDEVVAFVQQTGRMAWREVIAFVAERHQKSITTTTLRTVFAAKGVTKSALEKQAPTSPETPSSHRYKEAHRRKAPATGYPSDVTDAEWAVFEPILREHAETIPQDHDLRHVFNGLRYLLRTGCQWRYLPHEYPPWRTVQNWFQRWSKDGTFDKVVNTLRERVRQSVGREPTPSAIIIDSQSAKKAENGGPPATTRGRRSKVRSATSS